MAQADTKDRILDAAEQLFSEQGVRGVSLRAITTAAGVNLAAVNYHFGSKDELIKAVLARRIEPVNEERLRRLDALPAAGSPPELEAVLDALLRPAFEVTCDPQVGESCMRLIGRVQADAEPTYREFCQEGFRAVVERFTAAIAASCPHLSPADLMWRFQFMIGSMAFTMADTIDLGGRTGGLCDPRSAEDATRALVDFAAAGFRAPSRSSAVSSAAGARRRSAGSPEVGS